MKVPIAAPADRDCAAIHSSLGRSTDGRRNRAHSTDATRGGANDIDQALGALLPYRPHAATLARGCAKARRRAAASPRRRGALSLH